VTQFFYGNLDQTVIQNEVDLHVEAIALRGYSVLHAVFRDDLAKWRDKIDLTYVKQEEHHGRDLLDAISDVDMARALPIYDLDFLELATHPRVTAVAEKILGAWYVLSLQNAILNRPANAHHQAAWHRDLPYQNWTISRPLAVSALAAIDDFSELTGGTQLLPYSHKMENLPSDAYLAENVVTVIAPAGSVVMFDSMLFHRAGYNASNSVRRAVNQMFTVPILKQQYDFPRALGERTEFSSQTKTLLGYTCQVPLDDKTWRDSRALRVHARAEPSPPDGEGF